MVAALDAGTIEHGAVRGIRVDHLAFEDAPVLEREIENITMCRVWPGIEPYNRSLTTQTLQAVPHTAEIPMTAE